MNNNNLNLMSTIIPNAETQIDTICKSTCKESYKLPETISEKICNDAYKVARVNYTTGDYVILENYITTPEEALLIAKYEMSSSHHNEIIIVLPGYSIELSDDELKLASKLACRYQNKDKKNYSLATELKKSLEKIKEVVYNVFR